MNRVKVVTAYVPLNVLHMNKEQYFAFEEQMSLGVLEGGGDYQRIHSSIEDCWSYDMCTGLLPATDTPTDRYASPADHVRSHIVQHTRTQWALQTVEDAHETCKPDVVVWLDLGLLKQGKHTGKTITHGDVAAFVDKVSKYPFDDIPFPGITGREPWLPHGNNWRFCGSTHIWPVKWLAQIDLSYRYNLRHFIPEYGKVPLDLAIWPLVEFNSGLPFKWYQAEYDNTQLRNFPCVK